MPETEVRYIQQQSKAPNFVLGASLVVALGAVALTFGRDYLPDIGYETTNVSAGSGSVEEISITSPSRHLYTTYQTGWARVEDDSPAFLANPFAQEIAINQVKIMHDADTSRVYRRHSENIGAYIYVAFYDEDGKEVSLAPKDIYTRPSAPEACLLEISDDGRMGFDDQCTDEDDSSYTGARDFEVDSGGNINSDTSMIEKVAPYADIFRVNDYCINGNMLGGVYEGARTAEDGPDLDLMQERKLAILRSHYRRSVGNQLNMPLDRVLFKEDVDYLNREIDSSTFEMGDGMEYKVVGNMYRPIEPKTIADYISRSKAINLDSSIAAEIIELRDDISDVKLPEGLSRDATVLEARLHSVNTACYPGSDKSHEEFEQLLTNAYNFGAVCLPEGLKSDGTLDMEWAEQRIISLTNLLRDATGEDIPYEVDRNCGDTTIANDSEVQADVDNTNALMKPGED